MLLAGSLYDTGDGQIRKYSPRGVRGPVRVQVLTRVETRKFLHRPSALASLLCRGWPHAQRSELVPPAQPKQMKSDATPIMSAHVDFTDVSSPRRAQVRNRIFDDKVAPLRDDESGY